MSIERVAVVVNPRGGRRNGIRVLNRIAQIFSNAAIEMEVHLTDRVGHAGEIAGTLDLI